MRLIDADTLEKDYRSQFESVYKNTRSAVLPSDFYIQRKAAYDKELMRMEMEAFCEFLGSRPTIDAEPVRHGHWKGKPIAGYGNVKCSVCGMFYSENSGLWNYCPHCGAKMTEKE